MPRLVVTADIHLGITDLPRVMKLINDIAAEKPDMVAIAGDIGEGPDNIEIVLQEFKRLGVPVGVVAGNHDVWNADKTCPSKVLFETRIPKITKAAGATWLETENLIHEGIALVGSIAWYDYSAQDPVQKASSEECRRRKRDYDADAWMVDWEWNDLEFCEIIQPPFEQRLKSAQENENVREIVLITHSPIFDAQVTRKPQDRRWAFSNAYYGNLTFGEIASRFSKVTHAVAGHTHSGRDSVIDVEGRKMRVVTLPAEYGDPVCLVLDLPAEL